MKDNLVFCRSRIKAEYTPAQFMRKALVGLARKDAPIGVFDCAFSDVSVDEHQVFSKVDKVEASYQASIGYEREEPYTDTETYYEEVPYLAIEEYYDIQTQTRRKREVTKYRKVERHRPVTKYKTVIDWSVMQGKHETTAFSFTENNGELYLDEKRFGNSIINIEQESITVDPNLESISLRASTISEAEKKNEQQVYASIVASLPGDHFRDFSYSSNVVSYDAGLQVCPEYETTFTFNNERHRVKAFPFGPMELDIDHIQNPESESSVRTKSQINLMQWTKERNEQATVNIWNQTKNNFLISFGLMALSVIFSCFIHRTFLVVLLFLAAVGFAVYNSFLVKQITNKEESLASEEIKAEKEKTQNDVENYAANHKKDLFEALNKKLSALGLDPAKPFEIEP